MIKQLKKNKKNHICKNPACKKSYRACDGCGNTPSWRKICCSEACFQVYMRLIEESDCEKIEDAVKQVEALDVSAFEEEVVENLE